MTIHASYVPDVNSKITKREEETPNLKYNDAILKSDIDISKNNSINNKLSNLMNCLYGNINKEDMSVDLTSKINKLNSYFKEDYTNFAFYYEDLTTGLTMSFNDSQNVFAASVTKAPVAVYIYHLASVKQVSLDEKLTYTSNYYSG